MNALLSIDYTVEFVADTGRLTTGQAGQAIETTLVDHTQRFIDQGDFVVFAIDRHEAEDPYHPENQLFPPHNLAGSEGRNLYGTLAAVYEDHKEKENVYWIDKRHYSAFSGTDLDIRLRERGITALYLRITLGIDYLFSKMLSQVSIQSVMNGRCATLSRH